MPAKIAVLVFVLGGHLGEITAMEGAREVKRAQGAYNAATRQCSKLARHRTETW